MFLPWWLLPSLGRQGALSKLRSLTYLALPPPPKTARISTNGNTAIVGLWIEEGNFALYLVSRTTCKVGHSCAGIFSLLSLMGISTLNPDVRVFIAQRPGGGVPLLVYLFFLLHFALFSYHSICFFASSCPQISWFTDLLERVQSYNPPIRKSALLAFDHFWENLSYHENWVKPCGIP